jgi:hypothetical protein
MKKIIGMKTNPPTIPPRKKPYNRQAGRRHKNKIIE